MTRHLRRLLRLISIADGRSSEALQTAVGCSHATLVRIIAEARGLGVQIRFDRTGNCYRVLGGGIFDLQALRRVRL